MEDHSNQQKAHWNCTFLLYLWSFLEWLVLVVSEASDVSTIESLERAHHEAFCKSLEWKCDFKPHPEVYVKSCDVGKHISAQTGLRCKNLYWLKSNAFGPNFKGYWVYQAVGPIPGGCRALRERVKAPPAGHGHGDHGHAHEAGRLGPPKQQPVIFLKNPSLFGSTVWTNWWLIKDQNLSAVGLCFQSSYFHEHYHQPAASDFMVTQMSVSRAGVKLNALILNRICENWRSLCNDGKALFLFDLDLLSWRTCVSCVVFGWLPSISLQEVQARLRALMVKAGEQERRVVHTEAEGQKTNPDLCIEAESALPPDVWHGVLWLPGGVFFGLHFALWHRSTYLISRRVDHVWLKQLTKHFKGEVSEVSEAKSKRDVELR